MEMQLVGFTQREAALTLKALRQTTLHLSCLAHPGNVLTFKCNAGILLPFHCATLSDL